MTMTMTMTRTTTMMTMMDVVWRFQSYKRCQAGPREGLNSLA